MMTEVTDTGEQTQEAEAEKEIMADDKEAATTMTIPGIVTVIEAEETEEDMMNKKPGEMKDTTSTKEEREKEEETSENTRTQEDYAGLAHSVSLLSFMLHCRHDHCSDRLHCSDRRGQTPPRL